jgi:hypothetical protein
MIRRLAILLDHKAAEGNGNQPAKPDPKPANSNPDPAPEPGKEPDPEPEPEPGKEPEPEPEPDPAGDPLLKALLADMKPDPEIKPVKVEDEPAPEPAQPAEPELAPAPAKASEKPKKKKVKFEFPDPTPSHAPAAPTPEPAKAPEPAKDPDADYINGLTEDQKEELSEAEYLERLFPEKYQGRKKKLMDWYRNLDTTANKLLQDNPDRPLDASNEDFAKFLKTKPPVDLAHSRKAQRTMAEESAEQRVEAKIAPKITELERKQNEIEFKPQLDRMMSQMDNAMEELIASDDKSPLTPAIQALKADPNTPEFRLEKKIIDEEKRSSGKLSREYVMLTRGVRNYNEQNQTHKQLLEFINEQGRQMAAQPDEVKRDNKGRMFLSRSEYADAKRKDKDAASKYWTFSHGDILQMIGMQAKDNMESRLKQTLKEQEELGFVRGSKNNSANPPKAAPKKEPEAIAKPKLTPKPAKGSATDPKPQPNGNEIDVVGTLGLRR